MIEIMILYINKPVFYLIYIFLKVIMFLDFFQFNLIDILNIITNSEFYFQVINLFFRYNRFFI